MTFPSSPFPRTSCVSLNKPCCDSRCPIHWPVQTDARDAVCAEHGDTFNRFIGCPTCRFPILRASPLWRQTWVEDASSNGVQLVAVGGYWQVGGRWFPPLRCGPNGFGDPRKKIYTPDFKLLRLYTVDNCADCVAALQAVELMVYSCAQTAAEDAWSDEHRCWFGPLVDHWIDGRSCTCGAYCSLLDVQAWDGIVETAIHNWKLTLANEARRRDAATRRTAVAAPPPAA